jgi:hypothetical protein
MHRPIALLVLICCLAAAAFAPSAPGASLARSCSAPRYPGSGYFTSLRVTSVSCATGRSVTLAHYRCRTKRSKAGRCSSPGRGYRCTEKRQTISTEIDGRVTCKRGSRRVVYTYQQNI